LLTLLPAPLHRALLRIAQRVRLGVWSLLRREVRGCNVLAFDPAGRLLLVRHSYHAPGSWLLPGGGLARSEDPVSTGARELLEETGCRLENGAWIATDLRIMPGGWRNRIELIAGQTAGAPCPDGREIAKAAYFSLDALPAATGTPVLAALIHWREWQTSKG
jgi:8-oxo-dGTP pyrophosphatase MutT (NUDIX family)